METSKIELHRHLEGSLRLSTVLELAPQMGISVSAQPEEQFLVREPMKDLSAVLKKFWMSQVILASEEILTRITFEAIEDACADGIHKLELRYAPTYIQKGHENLSFQQIHEAILKGLGLAKKKLPQIQVGLICIIQRTLPVASAESIARFAVDNLETFIALDLADDEDKYPARLFAPAFDLAHKAGLPVTIHAGESNSPTAAQNVIDAIQILGARRIGHGLQIIKSPKALELVVKTQTPLEICVSSNWLTNAVPTLADHPIRQLMRAGVPVTINSDDPGIFAISLKHEYEVLKKSLGFTSEEFAQCQQVAERATFIKTC